MVRFGGEGGGDGYRYSSGDELGEVRGEEGEQERDE